ncbi:hypothetical protein PENTCL1PPCAC_23048 [Pristionchus entomophagus]|uniref:RNA-directed RNA polymerase n=1 Tax=Pristionchus entomophagus TaxID=358040 RepID=A0AAV5U229_9BILA|nr:hypothetical protein PENTCL1PPCAC_23048 [Pristionchus entomophagus]
MNSHYHLLDTSNTSLRIKCTIPWTSMAVSDAVHSAFKDTALIMERYYKVHSITDPIPVKDSFEFVVEVEPFCKPVVLFSLMQNFFKHVRLNNFRSDMMPVIMVSSPLFFSDSCIPDHAKVPIQSLYFGNIINSGTLGVHWTVEFYKNGSLLERDREQEKMKVSFEHDRGSVSIQYTCLEQNRDRTTQQNVEYTIKFYLSAIRRIIIDPLSIDNMKNEAKSELKFRFHFELNCPPEIRCFIEKEKHEKRFGDGNRIVHLSRGWGVDGVQPNGKWSEIPNRKCVAESTVVSLEFNGSKKKADLFEILSRLRVRSGIPIEFASMNLINLHWGIFWKMNPYVKDALECEAYKERIEWAAPNPPPTDVTKNNVCAHQFKLRYIIEALLSRGAKVKDQLLINVKAWTTFLDVLCGQYKRDSEKTLVVMESVMNRIDEMSFPVASIFRIIAEEFKAYNDLKKLNDAQMGLEARNDDMEREGYVKVRKIVITPSRYVYIAPEQIMGNRILRKYYKTQTEILRVTFRDDDTQPLRPNTTGEQLTKKTVETALKDGILVGGRNFRYLGSSNSQMRDNGCYFAYDQVPSYVGNEKKDENWRPSKMVARIRMKMGRLDELTNVAKFMARMGQCFTQSRAVNTGLPLRSSNFTFDITGGNSVQNDGDMYTYSDGVGQISIEYIKKIAKDLKLSNYPCVIQFRHRGYKGVLCLHPPLDETNRLRRKLELFIEEERGEGDEKEMIIVSKGMDENGDPFKLLNCRFRYSQMKFHAPEETDFEVVKISAPVPVALNKPFINILDQVSEMQSRESHIRMCDRVEELLHRQLRMMSETLVREKSCRDKLKELPRRYSIDGLSRQAGFALSTEPFFRSLVKAAIRYQIKKQLNKEQIQIPLDLGRSMFGVVDETGLLQYGQIFVQYHVNTTDKTPKPSASKVVQVGPTLITKNPCISAGDVRMFEAVDIPALRHLVDVVVFPMHGPRPHPDEMAGSDLDGDEYSVIWDPKLYLEKNESAMKFPKGLSKAVKLNMVTLDTDVRNFFIDYVTQDSVGMIANAHLNNSDLWGLESKVAKQVAYKHSEAVDFPKTSVAPAPLTKGWEADKETGEMIPPQRAHRKPDFMQSNRDPVYASSRLIGRIYREIGHVDNVLALSEERDRREVVKLDEMMDCPGWDTPRIKDQALASMIAYNNEIKALMERYGIASEGELMSGCMISIRNAISDREADDMSFFNTNQVIETQVTAIVRTHRENFFKEFGDIKKLTKVADDRRNVSDETDNIFEREVVSPSDEMRKKAVALYKVTYGEASKQTDSSARLLSYPWIAYDVLAKLRQENISKKHDFIAGLDPVDEMLSQQVLKYARENEMKFREKMASWTGEDKKDYGEEAAKRYLNYYDGLGELCFFFVKWAEHEDVSMRPFREIHIVLLVIQFCLGCYDELEAVITPIEQGVKPVEPRVCITELGKVVLNFLRWLSSRSFKRMTCLSFEKPDLGVEGCFMRGEWMPMHLAAIKSFYDLIFSLRFDLPTTGDLVVDPPSIIREMTPFVVELPKTVPVATLEELIKRQTGATEVRMRRLTTAEQTRVVVCATGTLLSHTKIRNLLIVPLAIKTCDNPQDMSDNFPQFIHAKIVDGAQKFGVTKNLMNLHEELILQ